MIKCEIKKCHQKVKCRILEKLFCNKHAKMFIEKYKEKQEYLIK